ELASLVVALVDRDEDRRLRPAEQLGGLLVGRGEPGDRLNHEDDQVRLGDGDTRLVLDARLDRVARIDLQPAGVDDHEPPPVPFGLAVEAVAGCSRAILHDRRAAADDAVEQGRLADVRPADDSDDRDGVHVVEPYTEPARGGWPRWCGQAVRAKV